MQLQDKIGMLSILRTSITLTFDMNIRQFYLKYTMYYFYYKFTFYGHRGMIQYSYLFLYSYIKTVIIFF